MAVNFDEVRQIESTQLAFRRTINVYLLIFTDAFFKKALRWGYSSELRRLSVLLHEADAQLFRKMINNKEHCICIHQLLPPEKFYPRNFVPLIVYLHCHNGIITCTSVRLYYVVF